ncbi:MAG: hypothetical protein GOU98_02030 [Candidatus Altiarchaeota archaeon]|nr:hypothetical protein [Candidatus Altiarchaeota archaeon]
MSSGSTDMNMYALFQAVSLVMGTAALFYTMKGIAGAEGVKIVTEQIGRMAQRLVQGVFEGLGNML